jgi:hypothetical protein
MVSKQYILDQARQKGIKAWYARNNRYSIEASYDPKGGAGSSEDAVNALENFFNNASGVYEIEMRDRSGFGSPMNAKQSKETETYFAEVHLAPSERRVSGTNIGEGSPNIDMIRGYESSLRTVEMNAMKSHYESELRRKDEQIEKMMDSHRKELEDAKDSSKNIMGYLSQISSMFNSNPVGERNLNGVGEAPATSQKSPSVQKTIDAVNKLLELDPDFPENISKLAKLAASNPVMYRQAVSILNQF